VTRPPADVQPLLKYATVPEAPVYRAIVEVFVEAAAGTSAGSRRRRCTPPWPTTVPLGTTTDAVSTTSHHGGNRSGLNPSRRTRASAE
jgi:hypothetical protein